MNHGVDPVAGEERLQRSPIANVGLDEIERSIRDLRDAIERLRAAVREIVDDDDVVSGRQALHRGVRTDVARAAGQ